MIPSFDYRKIATSDPDTLSRLRAAAEDIGFMTVTDTPVTPARMRMILATYAAFFDLPEADKRHVDMTVTGSNRGYGGPKSEQVDPTANPDYKQVFDCGFTLPDSDPRSAISVYAPNRWPDVPGFKETIGAYYRDALTVSLTLLRGIAEAIGQPRDYFDDKFDTPMALLRGNFYPQRPADATDKDFGIAPHTDYGCLTLLGTDGVAGLEVLARDDTWVPVNAGPGTFVINFGEMLEMWTGGKVKATLHRVVGTSQERISVPMFFNPNYDANVATMGSDKVIRAGEHLSKRYNETYIHLKAG